MVICFLPMTIWGWGTSITCPAISVDFNAKRETVTPVSSVTLSSSRGIIIIIPKKNFFICIQNFSDVYAIWRQIENYYKIVFRKIFQYPPVVTLTLLGFLPIILISVWWLSPAWRPQNMVLLFDRKNLLFWWAQNGVSDLPIQSFWTDNLNSHQGWRQI